MTSGITRRQTLTMHRLEAHRRCPAGFASQGLVLRAPRSLPPMPVPGAAAHHWYKGWETGPWGEEAASGSAQRLLFTPAQEGGGSCQRKWGRIKEGRKGQGQVRGGHRPNSSLQQARPTLGQRGRDPEGGVRAPPTQVFPFGVGPPCLQQQQPSSPVSSQRSLGRLLGTPSCLTT